MDAGYQHTMYYTILTMRVVDQTNTFAVLLALSMAALFVAVLFSRSLKQGYFDFCLIMFCFTSSVTVGFS